MLEQLQQLQRENELLKQQLQQLSLATSQPMTIIKHGFHRYANEAYRQLFNITQPIEQLSILDSLKPQHESYIQRYFQALMYGQSMPYQITVETNYPNLPSLSLHAIPLAQGEEWVIVIQSPSQHAPYLQPNTPSTSDEPSNPIPELSATVAMEDTLAWTFEDLNITHQTPMTAYPAEYQIMYDKYELHRAVYLTIHPQNSLNAIRLDSTLQQLIRQLGYTPQYILLDSATDDVSLIQQLATTITTPTDSRLLWVIDEQSLNDQHDMQPITTTARFALKIASESPCESISKLPVEWVIIDKSFHPLLTQSPEQLTHRLQYDQQHSTVARLLTHIDTMHDCAVLWQAEVRYLMGDYIEEKHRLVVD